MPGVGHRVTHRGLRRPLIESRFEERNKWHRGHPLGEESDTGDVGRIVGRCDSVERLHSLEDAFIELDTAVDAPRHNGLEPDRSKVSLGFYMTGILKLRQTFFYRPRVIAHALETAFVQKALRAAGELIEPPLERSEEHTSELQ